MVSRILIALCVVALASVAFGDDRERKVKVALALAEAKAQSVEVSRVADPPLMRETLDWFGEKPLVLKVPPVLREPVYRAELQSQCYVDRFGIQRCRLVEVLVPVKQ